MIDQKQLWLQYLQALAQSVQLAPGEALQATYPFQSWNWGGRDPEPSSFPYEQWAMLNVVPSNPYQNTNSGAAASALGFDVAYQAWFDQLAIGDLQKDQPYQQLQDAVNNSAAQNSRDWSNAQNTWKNQTGGTTPSFETWLRQPAQLGLMTSLDEDAADVKAKQSELDQYRSRIQTPVKTIVDQYNDADYQGYATDPNSGKSVKLRLWTTVPQNPYAYVEQITKNSFGSDASAGSPLDVTIKSSSDSYDYSEYTAEGGGGFWDDFIGIEAGGEFQQVDWSSFSSQYSLTFSWQDLTTVTVAPEGWYAGTDITTYGQGPYATGFSAFGNGGGNHFFGAGGGVSRIYTGMIVGYRPTITIDAGEEFATYLMRKWKAEAGIEIGPFLFGGETSGENTASSASTDGGTFVIKSKADWPFIVAMKSAWTLSPPS